MQQQGVGWVTICVISYVVSLYFILMINLLFSHVSPDCNCVYSRLSQADEAYKKIVIWTRAWRTLMYLLAVKHNHPHANKSYHAYYELDFKTLFDIIKVTTISVSNYDYVDISSILCMIVWIVIAANAESFKIIFLKRCIT